ncbi:uncharacterized protein BDZ99DRAFT_500897 [Mytilinidion resinicola]|uniref:2-hydroxyacyl-CoA lyase n=1 Tax=Mytilinidion resinicola TaxID=574789 RepID=A0A6A6YDF2_9PEZI|nr:uncharacterized protein BDZ99DRAFT_500897 [Mytilinidion resinicola]KAF2806852.1 hypothetical protein BDZ99DRAFT_500897 [Mytilinidion resinicola]
MPPWALALGMPLLHEAYNGIAAEAKFGSTTWKKFVAIEGDSAFGFSGMDVETMARFQMDVLIFVINNGGIYFGGSNSAKDWLQRQAMTVCGASGPGVLRSWALDWEVWYEKIAEACGGKGFLLRTPEELRKAPIEGFHAKAPCIVNVIIQSGKVGKPNFSWQSSSRKKENSQRSSKRTSKF